MAARGLRAGAARRWARAALGAAGALSCAGGPDAAPPLDAEAPDSAPLVVLISLDTTRADALGCYADVNRWGLDLDPALRPAPRTPALDTLAAGGLRARHAYAQAPTTLSSHATLFTGLDPHGHRVPRNGFPLPADGPPTVAEALRAAGYTTLGAVGASVLDDSQGLGRGFDAWDDEAPQRVRRRHERPAAEVVAAALRLVDARPRGRPTFLFVHLFDPHSPWDGAPAELQEALLQGIPDVDGLTRGASAEVDALVRDTKAGRAPEAARRRARALYLAEVAAADAAVGALLDGLRARFDGGPDLVVVVGDHGEALDEPAARPYGHGGDVHLEATHVPLLLWGEGVPVGAVHEPPVGLLDVASTLLARRGLGPLGQGADLLAAAPRPVFSEATKPADRARPGEWENLQLQRAVVDEGHQLLISPWEGRPPALRPIEPSAAAAGPQPELQARLMGALLRWDAAAPGPRGGAEDPGAVEGLKALGYLE